MAALVTEVPKVVLAVYAHPDDADVAAAGTLARWSALGTAVHLLVCTDGGRGTRDPKTTPASVAKQRAGELEASGAIVGLASHEVLGAPDGELGARQGLVEELVRVVRAVRPEVVLGHDPTAVFFGQQYFNHRDHRAAGWALLDALSPSAALPHYFPEAGPPHDVETVLLSGTLEPDAWVDISGVIEQKVAAVECHRSQFSATASETGWVADAVRGRAAEEGRRAGVRYAEGFRRLCFGA